MSNRTSENNFLTETLAKYGDRFIRAYQREPGASGEELESSGYLSSEENGVLQSIAPINEYVVFQTSNIPQGEIRTFNLGAWHGSLDFKSIYVENPSADYFYLRLIDSNNTIIINQYFPKDQTPVNLPINPIPNNLKLQIVATKPISFIRIVAVPCMILETFLAEEDTAQN